MKSSAKRQCDFVFNFSQQLKLSLQGGENVCERTPIYFIEEVKHAKRGALPDVFLFLGEERDRKGNCQAKACDWLRDFCIVID